MIVNTYFEKIFIFCESRQLADSVHSEQVRTGRQRAKDGKIRCKDLMDENGEKVYDGFTRLVYANLRKTAQRLWGCRTAAVVEAAVFHHALPY